MTKPFRHLSSRAQVLFLLRFSVALMLLVLLSILMNPDHAPDRLYVARIDTSRKELGKGLFETLQSNMKSHDSLITTAEIKLLAQYTEEEIDNISEVLFSHLEYSCYKDFTSAADDDDNDDGLEANLNAKDAKPQLVEEQQYICHEPDVDYVLDYRQELSTMGVNIILAYAYDANFIQESPNSGFTNDKIYKPSKEYTDKIESVRHHSKLVLIWFSTAIGLCTWMVMGTVIYYGFREEDEMDDSRYPLLWRHLVGILSLAICVLVVLGSISKFILTKMMQQTIHDELSKYGIKMSLGSAWFSLMWFAFGLSIVLLALWGGAVWCNRKVHLDSEEKVVAGGHYDDSEELIQQKDILDDKYPDFDYVNPFEDQNEIEMDDLARSSSKHELVSNPPSYK